MEFRILGPLEVVDDGRPVSIRRGKEQALFIYLLLHANEVIPSGRLIDALWDERPPPTASKILQNAVSHLRKELGEGRLLTQDPGYVLRVQEDELDAQKFERLAREGRSNEALALWRGPALLELQEERFADEARRRLDEERLAVLEDRVDADLEAGRHAGLVPELEGLVAANPLRDRLEGQLMLALYRAGRQTEALDVYQRARNRLSEELGLEPSPQLQDLERRILNHDPQLAAPRPSRERRERGRPQRKWALPAMGALLLAVAAAVTALVLTRGGGSESVVATAGSLAVIDPAKNRVTDAIHVGNTPRGVAVSSHSVWVANSGDGTLVRLDPDKKAIVGTIGVGGQPTAVAAEKSGVWVTTGIDDTLTHIDAQTGGVLGTVRPRRDEATDSTLGVAVADGTVWLAAGRQLFAIDASSGQVRRRNVYRDIFGLNDVAAGAGSVWLADVSEQLVRVYPGTGRASVTTHLGGIPLAVAVGYDAVWVSVESTSTDRLNWVAEIDPGTLEVKRAISFAYPGYPHGIAIGANAVWVASFSDGTVVRIDRNDESTKVIHVGGHPYGIAFGAGRVWVTVD